ncbi:hypothetical protein OIU79_023857 [Salix purpurea]|uniref:Uncharacterized protein n=1 Tax=Salix purpurea TaxID=77065 RepID=A0A9Q0WCM3_SALPP|nr:hypothetical protein OIU79_023857 [Salix purpurea]
MIFLFKKMSVKTITLIYRGNLATCVKTEFIKCPWFLNLDPQLDIDRLDCT